MKKPLFIQLALLLLFSSCTKEIKTDPKKVYNEEFKWSIVIPENFTNVDPDVWVEMQSKGVEAIENTYGEKLVDQTNTIFVFKNADFNYLESNYQPFDEAIDGDYLESCKAVNGILYETFMTQMPGVVIDSSRSVEKISNLDFQTFKMKIDLPNGITMHSLMYSRLFDKKEFSVNIMYVDDEQGKKMVKAWTNSTFE